jgi:hypothetical protein
MAFPRVWDTAADTSLGLMPSSEDRDYFLQGERSAEREIVSWACRVDLPELFVFQLVVSYIHLSAVHTASEAARWWSSGAAQVERRLCKVRECLNVDFRRADTAEEAREFLRVIYQLGAQRGLSIDLRQQILLQLAYVAPCTLAHYRSLWEPVHDSRLARGRRLLELTNDGLKARMDEPEVQEWLGDEYRAHDYHNAVPNARGASTSVYPDRAKVNKVLALLDYEDGLVPMPPRGFVMPEDTAAVLGLAFPAPFGEDLDDDDADADDGADAEVLGVAVAPAAAAAAAAPAAGGGAAAEDGVNNN